MEGRREREKVERGYPNPTLSATSVRDLLDNHSRLAEFYKFRLQPSGYATWSSIRIRYELSLSHLVNSFPNTFCAHFGISRANFTSPRSRKWAISRMPRPLGSIVEKDEVIDLRLHFWKLF